MISWITAPMSAVFCSSPASPLVDHGTGQQIGVTRILHPHLAEHLANDDLVVLVIDRHALTAVDVLGLREEIVLKRLDTRDAQDVVRDQRSVDQRITSALTNELASIFPTLNG